MTYRYLAISPLEPCRDLSLLNGGFSESLKNGMAYSQS